MAAGVAMGIINTKKIMMQHLTKLIIAAGIRHATAFCTTTIVPLG
jgi:hypothetical protein